MNHQSHRPAPDPHTAHRRYRSAKKIVKIEKVEEFLTGPAGTELGGTQSAPYRGHTLTSLSDARP